MSETAQKSVLLELVGKHYTGDAQGYDRGIVPSSFVSSVPEPIRTPETPITHVPSPQSDSIVPKEIASGEGEVPRKLTKAEADEIRQGEKEYQEALAFIKDAIAPAMMKVDARQIQIGDTLIRSVFTYAYPDFLEGNWLSPLINWDVKFDMSMFIYPIEGAFVMKFLKKRLTELYSERSINADKGLINDPALEAQIQDVEELR
jgi:hypothetical protein